jgi:hypothetical protein
MTHEASNLPESPPLRSPVTWRSVLLGMVGVVFICGLTPYNDYVVNNTFLVGNYLPVGLLLLFVVFSLVLNAPLARLSPRLALSNGEVAVAFAMALVSCALPSSGLMRYLPSNLITFHHLSAQNPDYADVLRGLNLPDWIFPATASADTATKPVSWTPTTVTDPAARASDDVVRYFFGRVPVQSGSFIDRFLAVPWWAWARPAVVWGALMACLGGVILCGAVIVRRQWSDNERLPFPLAGVFQSVIEQPESGRSLNPLLRSPLFWIGFFLVFFIHSTNALAAFFPRNVPTIPLKYEFYSVMSQEPISHVEWYTKTSTIYFCVIGLCFFMQTAVSFSLWFFVIALQIVMMIYGTYQLQMTDGMRSDQNLGGVVAFVVAVLWIGRAHWLLVARQMLRGRQGDEPPGRYLSYPVAGWGLLVCSLGAFLWLYLVGCTAIGAAALVVMVLMFFIAAARIVAETGIPFLQFNGQFFRLWTFLAPMGVRTTNTSFFFSTWMHGLLVHDMRESAAVFTGQALRMADQGAYESPGRWRRTWPLAACLVLALSSAFVVSGAAMLYVEYAYAAPLDRNAVPPINPYAIDGQPKGQILDPTLNYLRGGTGANDSHNPVTHFTLGAGITAFLAAMRLRFTAWPLHPVGFLLLYCYPIRMIWFSIFIGWLCKTIVVRFGGIELFRALRPLFLGLIIGEAGAVAFWLMTNLVLVQFGIEYYKTSILPT